MNTEQKFETQKEWTCWTLSIEDIEESCNNIYVKFEKLSEEQIQDIVYNFKKGFEAVNQEWGEILEEAINEVIENG